MPAWRLPFGAARSFRYLCAMKRRCVYGMVLVAACLACLSCREGRPGGGGVRFGVLPGPTAVSALHLACRADSVGGRPLEVRTMASPLYVQAALAKGELDFAVLPTVMAANLYNKGVDCRLLACPVWGTLYIMSCDTAVRRLADLQGDGLALFGRGSTADVLVRALMRQEGVGCRVDYRYTTNAEVAQALRARRVRAAVVSEPLASVLMAEDGGIALVHRLDAGAGAEGFAQAALVVRGDWAGRHPGAVRAVCEAYRRSCEAAYRCPRRTASLMVRHGLAPTEEAALRSLPLCHIAYVPAPAVVPEVRRYLQLMWEYSPEAIGGRLPDEGFIVNP